VGSSSENYVAPLCCASETFLDTKLKKYLKKKKAKKEIFNLQNSFENINNKNDNSQRNLETNDNNYAESFDCENAEAEKYFEKLNINLNSSNLNNLNKQKNTDYIFKEFFPAKNFDKDISEIEKLGLERNDYSDFDSDSQITHSLLPTFLRNDEAYKKRLLNFLRLPQHQQKGKTEKIRFGIKRKFNEIAETSFNGNVTKYYEVLGIKRKNCVSLRKQFESFYSVEGEKGKMHFFRMFKDSEIGLEKVWQRQLKISVNIYLFCLYQPNWKILLVFFI